MEKVDFKLFYTNTEPLPDRSEFWRDVEAVMRMGHYGRNHGNDFIHHDFIHHDFIHLLIAARAEKEVLERWGQRAMSMSERKVLKEQIVDDLFVQCICAGYFV